MLEPLQKLDELEFVLTRVWDKRLSHNQKVFWCGSSACVAGWIYILDHENLPDPSMFRADRIRNVLGAVIWEYATLKFNLSRDEANLLFNPLSTKLVQEKVLEALKAGRRLDVDKNFWCLIKSSGYWSKKAVIFTTLDAYSHQLLEFLGGSILIEDGVLVS